MIVDDENLMIEGVASMLASMRRVLPNLELAGTARDTDEALAVARKNRPDLVVMDVLMRSGRGMETTEAIVAAVPGCKIIGSSTCLVPKTIQEMLDAGAKGYLSKTHDGANELQAAIRVLSAGTRVLFLSDSVQDAFHDPNARISNLTPREREVLAMRCSGYVPKEIAADLGLETTTIYTYLETIKAKSGISDVIQLYPLALREGLIELPG
jgi:DNA-binding NarL/FixJ family response regulator